MNERGSRADQHGADGAGAETTAPPTAPPGAGGRQAVPPGSTRRRLGRAVLAALAAVSGSAIVAPAAPAGAAGPARSGIEAVVGVAGMHVRQAAPLPGGAVVLVGPDDDAGGATALVVADAGGRRGTCVLGAADAVTVGGLATTTEGSIVVSGTTTSILGSCLGSGAVVPVPGQPAGWIARLDADLTPRSLTAIDPAPDTTPPPVRAEPVPDVPAPTAPSTPVPSDPVPSTTTAPDAAAPDVTGPVDGGMEDATITGPGATAAAVDGSTATSAPTPTVVPAPAAPDPVDVRRVAPGGPGAPAGSQATQRVHAAVADGGGAVVLAERTDGARTLVAVEPDGTRRWAVAVEPSASSLVLSGANVVVGSGDAATDPGLSARSRADGTPVWQVTVGITGTAPTGLVTANDGSLAWVQGPGTVVDPRQPGVRNASANPVLFRTTAAGVVDAAEPVDDPGTAPRAIGFVDRDPVLTGLRVGAPYWWQDVMIARSSVTSWWTSTGYVTRPAWSLSRDHRVILSAASTGLVGATNPSTGGFAAELPAGDVVGESVTTTTTLDRPGSFAVVLGSPPAPMTAPSLGTPAWLVSNAGAGKAISYEPGNGGGLVSDRFGNTYVAGDLTGPVGIRSTDGNDVGLESGPSNAAYVARYGTDGRVITARMIAFGASVDTLGTDPAGNVYVVAHSVTPDLTVPKGDGTQHLGSGAVVIKLTASLQVMWATRVTTNTTPHTTFPYDSPAAASGNASGEVAVLAYDTVARLDRYGHVLTQRRDAVVADLALADDGTLYESVRNSAGLRARAADGTIAWTVGRQGVLRGAGLALAPDGSIAWSALVSGPALIGTPGGLAQAIGSGTSPFVVSRIGPDGRVRWVSGEGLTGYGSWITQDPRVATRPDGSVVAVVFDGSSLTHLSEYEPSGILHSHTTATTVYWYLPTLRVAVDAAGGIDVAGTHARNMTFGNLSVPPPPIASFFLAHWGPVADPAPGSLVVRALDGSTPVSGIQVGVADANVGATPGRWATTDANGEARFGDLPAGRYRATLLDPSGRYQRGWYAGAPTFASATDVAVLPTQTTTVDALLDPRPAGGVVGHVADDTGMPLAGIVAQLYSAKGFVRSASTGPAGGFLFAGVPDGAYRVRLVDPSGRYLARWAGADTDPATGAVLAVAGDLATVDTTLTERRIDLAADTSFTTGIVRAGSTFPLSVDVTNAGPDATPSADVTLTLPSGLHVVDAVGTAGGNRRGDDWRTGPLAAGSSAYAIFTVAVDADRAGTTLDVAAHVSGPGAEQHSDDNESHREVRAIEGPRPDGRFAVTVSGPGEAITYGIATDDAGNTYASGWFRGLVTFGEGPEAVTWSDDRPIPDMWFAKYDPSGRLVWVRRGMGRETMDPTAGGIAVARDGSLYVTGFFEGEATFGDGSPGPVTPRTITSSYGTQMFLLKFAPDGRLVWAQQFGNHAYGWNVVVGPDGLVHVAGRDGGGQTCDYSRYPYTCRTFGSGGYVATYDAAGRLQRVLRQSSSVDDPQAMARNLAVGPDNILHVVGTFGPPMTFAGGSTTPVTLTSRGGWDSFLASYTPGGKLLRVLQFGGPGTERLSGVQSTTGGDVFVAGRLEAGAQVGNGSRLSPPVTTSGGYLGRIGFGGAVRWLDDLGANVRQVVVDRRGAPYVMGGFSDASGLAPDSAAGTDAAWGPEDAWVMKYKPDGTPLWSIRGGGARRDVAFTATVGADDLVHIGGSTSADGVFCLGPDSSPTRAPGKTNAFVATCAAPYGSVDDWHDGGVHITVDGHGHQTGPDPFDADVTVTVRNDGPQPLEGAAVAMSLPAGATITGGDATDGTTWRPGPVAPGTTATLHLTATLPPVTAPTTLPFLARLQQPAPDVSPGNDGSLARLAVTGSITTPPTTTPPTTPTTTAPTTTTPTTTAPTTTAPTTTSAPTTTAPRRAGVGGPSTTRPATTTTSRPVRTPPGGTDGTSGTRAANRPGPSGRVGQAGRRQGTTSDPTVSEPVASDEDAGLVPSSGGGGQSVTTRPAPTTSPDASVELAGPVPTSGRSGAAPGAWLLLLLLLPVGGMAWAAGRRRRDADG